MPNQSKSQQTAPSQISHFLNNCFPDLRYYLGSNKFLAFCLLSTKMIWIKEKTLRQIPTFFHLPAVIVLFSSCLKNCKQISRPCHAWEQRGIQQCQEEGWGLFSSRQGFQQLSSALPAFPEGIQNMSLPAAEMGFQVGRV